MGREELAHQGLISLDALAGKWVVQNSESHERCFLSGGPWTLHFSGKFAYVHRESTSTLQEQTLWVNSILRLSVRRDADGSRILYSRGAGKNDLTCPASLKRARFLTHDQLGTLYETQYPSLMIASQPAAQLVCRRYVPIDGARVFWSIRHILSALATASGSGPEGLARWFSRQQRPMPKLFAHLDIPKSHSIVSHLADSQQPRESAEPGHAHQVMPQSAVSTMMLIVWLAHWATLVQRFLLLRDCLSRPKVLRSCSGRC